MLIEKVISGGQNGVDQAGLRAARDSGILTGGWLPQGCITLDGPRPDLLELYSMQEHPKKGYPPRTEANVRDSDGTIRIAKYFTSPGEKCTLKAIKWFKKTYFDVHIENWTTTSDMVDALVWIKQNDIKILNVAGNSEDTWPGINDMAYRYLVEFFKRLRNG
jgi:hypothetical protein